MVSVAFPGGLRVAVAAIVGALFIPLFLCKDLHLDIRTSDKGVKHRLLGSLYSCYLAMHTH